MSDESWFAYGSKLTGKLALRVYLTSVMPGLGALVDFAETAADSYADNSVGAVVNLLSWASNLATSVNGAFGRMLPKKVEKRLFFKLPEKKRRHMRRKWWVSKLYGVWQKERLSKQLPWCFPQVQSSRLTTWENLSVSL